jgi:hypothetical protein
LNTDSREIEIEKKLKNGVKIYLLRKLCTIDHFTIFEVGRFKNSVMNRQLFIVDGANDKSDDRVKLLFVDLPKLRSSSPYAFVKFTMMSSHLIKFELHNNYFTVNLSNLASSSSSSRTKVSISKIKKDNTIIHHNFPGMPDIYYTLLNIQKSTEESTSIQYFKCQPNTHAQANENEERSVYLVSRNVNYKDGGTSRQVVDLVVVDPVAEDLKTIVKSTRIDLFEEKRKEKGWNEENDHIDKIIEICPDNNQLLLVFKKLKLILHLTILTDESVKVEPFHISNLETEKFIEDFCSSAFSINFFQLAPSKNDYFMAAKKVATWTNLTFDLANIIVHF